MTTKDNIRAFVNIHLKDADEATKDDAIKNLEDLVQAAIEESKPKPSGKTKEEILEERLESRELDIRHSVDSKVESAIYESMDEYAVQAIAEHDKEMSSKLTNKLDNTHQQFQISGNGPIVWDVTNVPGGYIYSYIRLDCGQMMCCFVPTAYQRE